MTEKWKVSLPILGLVSALLSIDSQPAANATVKAPSLRNCHTAAQRDLGVWDDVFVFEDQDFIVVRRCETLFSLSITKPSELIKLVTSPETKSAEIILAGYSENKLWLFLQSSKTAPFAIDAHSGKVCQFSIPGLKIPGNHAPGIQSYVLIRHANAILLMVSGGDQTTWPRDGNRPVYFWMSLKSGKVVPFPIGWDLEYFSSDQTVAVFAKARLRNFDRRPLQAVDVRTGAETDELPDRQKEACVPFNWTETQEVKPLYVRHKDTGDRDYFAGITVNGRALPLDLGLDEVHYLSTATSKDDFVAFRLRREGKTSAEPSSLWLIPFNQPGKLERIQATVTGFALLRGGVCAFVTSGHGPKGESFEAFLYSHQGKFMWNMLDDVERLSELDRQVADKDYVEDKMTVRLIDGFGGLEHGSLMICLFSRFRGDMRAYIGASQGKRLEPTTWRRALILTSSGERYMTDLFREGSLADQIWAHNSGRIVVGNYAWPSPGSRRERKVKLTQIDLELK
jgi:hypothetical protein